jgi:hypothetical protein
MGKKKSKKGAGLDSRGYSCTSTPSSSIRSLPLDQTVVPVSPRTASPEEGPCKNAAVLKVNACKNGAVLKVNAAQIGRKFEGQKINGVTISSADKERTSRQGDVNISAQSNENLNELADSFLRTLLKHENEVQVESSVVSVKKTLKELQRVKKLLETKQFQQKVGALQLMLMDFGFNNESDFMARAVIGVLTNDANTTNNDGQERDEWNTSSDDILPVESVLDWLCLHLPSSDLPPRFTEVEVREAEKGKTNNMFSMLVEASFMTSCVSFGSHLITLFNILFP